MEDESIDLDKFKQVDSKDEIESLVKSILEEYPESVKDYKNGHNNAIKFLMGMCMKKSQGKINPKMAMDILQKFLEQ